jgi:hypothetical protein
VQRVAGQAVPGQAVPGQAVQAGAPEPVVPAVQARALLPALVLLRAQPQAASVAL